MLVFSLCKSLFYFLGSMEVMNCMDDGSIWHAETVEYCTEAYLLYL